MFSFDFSPQSLILLLYYYPPRKAPLIVGNLIRPFPSSPEPLYQNKVKCSAFDMEMTFHSRGNKTHFYKKGSAPGPSLKVRVFGTRKWLNANGSLFTSNKLSLSWSRENAIPRSAVIILVKTTVPKRGFYFEAKFNQDSNSVSSKLQTLQFGR